MDFSACEICGVQVNLLSWEENKHINRAWEDYECVCIECINCDLYTRYERPKNSDVFYAGWPGWEAYKADGSLETNHLPQYGPHLPDPPRPARDPFQLQFHHSVLDLFWVVQQKAAGEVGAILK